jgi:hypothetical protein
MERALGLILFYENNTFSNLTDDKWGLIYSNVSDDLLCNNLSFLLWINEGNLDSGTRKDVNYINSSFPWV